MLPSMDDSCQTHCSGCRSLWYRSKFGAEPNQTAGRNNIFQAGLTVEVLHIGHFTFYERPVFHNRTMYSYRHIYSQRFIRLTFMAFDFFDNYLRFDTWNSMPSRRMVSIKNGQMQFAAACHFKVSAFSVAETFSAMSVSISLNKRQPVCGK